MKSEKEHNLIYHSLHSRPMPGCMPLFMLLSALFLGGLMLLVQVDMPKRLRPKGEGNIYYRDDSILRFQISQRSPTPLYLPAALDPVRQENASAAVLSWTKPVSLLPLDSPRIYTPAPDSAVLDENALIALPPVQQEAAGAPAAHDTEPAPAPQENPTEGGAPQS